MVRMLPHGMRRWRAGLGVVACLAASVPAQARVQDGAEPLSDACAVIGAVTQELYDFDGRAAPPLRSSGNYLPDCPWAAMGLAFEAESTDRPTRWLSFGRPRITGDEAVIRTGVMRARLSGQGMECRLSRIEGVWRVRQCRRTWVS